MIYKSSFTSFDIVFGVALLLMPILFLSFGVATVFNKEQPPSEEMECFLNNRDIFECRVEEDSCVYYYENTHFFPVDYKLIKKECE